MKFFSTTKCGASGHPEIGFHIHEHSGLTPHWLIDYFESEVSNGRQFKAGHTIQIGWMIVTLKGGERGVLEIWEPNFDSFPIEWCKGANNTLRHLVLQKSVCSELGCEPLFPSLQQAGVISPEFFKSHESYFGSRDNPVNTDSGWVLHEFGYNGTQGEFKSLYEISLHHMWTIPFLALPPGASVHKQALGFEVKYEGRVVTTQSSELLKRLFEMPILI